MSDQRLAAYLSQIRSAATDALSFVDGYEKAQFLKDRRTQQAVILSLLIIGEASARMIDHYPEFTAANSDVPWTSMRGMRNRIAHGYFEINLDVVWQTIGKSLPDLLEKLSRLPPT